jgi:hypothetical protein
MLTYPNSIIGYFILGVAGACTFVFLMLMFDKDVAILRNERVGLPWMILIYALLGGVVSAVVNLASNPEFGASQLTLAFSAGMGWPALATGISAAKKVGDVNENAVKRIKENKESIEKIEGFKQSEREKFINDKLAEFDAVFKKAQELQDKELERVKEYYLKELSSGKGR